MASHDLTLLLFSFLLLLKLHSSSAQNQVKGGYWFPAREFPVSSIDSSLFTNLFCAFADLDPGSYQVVIASQNQQPFSTFTRTVQQRNPSVKTLLSIGGGGSNRTAFASMASQPGSRKSFIDSSIRIARSYNFHGLDLDWESPQNAAEMANMGILLDEWRQAVITESRNSGRPQLLLTAAVHYSPFLNSATFPVDSIGRSLDWINVMAYDYYMPSWYRATGAHTILFNQPNRSSTDAGIRAWIGAGLSPNKMLLGLAYYGYAWTLANPADHGIGAPATGPALSPTGAIRYKDIRAFIRNTGATVVFDANIVSNYCYSGTTWIGYDDVESIVRKVLFAKEKGLRGYFAWHVANDDNWVLSREALSRWGQKKKKLSRWGQAVETREWEKVKRIEID